MDISHKVRTNAAISYFFLGFLFLLAGRNSNFADPFVRSHAKSATKIHLLLIGYIVLHQMLISKLFSMSIPFVPISPARILLIVIFTYVFLQLFLGASRAFTGKPATGFSLSLDLGMDNLSGVTANSESEMIRGVLSFVPFVGVFIYEYMKTPLTRLGVRVGGLMSVLSLLLFVFSRGESVLVSLVFFYIVLLVTIGILLFLGKGIEFLGIFSVIPGLEDIALVYRTLPRYIADIGLAIVGKKDDLSFKTRMIERYQAEAKTDEELAKYFNGSSGPFSPYLIYIPGLNLLYIVRFFAPGKSPYVMAIGQGMMLTALVGAAMYFYSPFDPILSLALLPIGLGLATIKSRPFYRIPVLYEISALMSFLSFGLVSSTKAIRTKSQEEKTVSYKV